MCVSIYRLGQHANVGNNTKETIDNNHEPIIIMQIVVLRYYCLSSLAIVHHCPAAE